MISDNKLTYNNNYVKSRMLSTQSQISLFSRGQKFKLYLFDWSFYTVTLIVIVWLVILVIHVWLKLLNSKASEPSKV